MSSNYDRYKNMSPDELQQRINEKKVSLEYLSWLGISGPGAQLREVVKEK